MGNKKDETIIVHGDNVTYGNPGLEKFIEDEKKAEVKEEKHAAKSPEYVWANAEANGWKNEPPSRL